MGTYDERLIDNVPSGTSWDNSVRIANYNGETVTLFPTSGGGDAIHLANAQKFIEFDGINLTCTATVGHCVFFGNNGGAPISTRPTDTRFINGSIQGRTSSSGSVPSCFWVGGVRGYYANTDCTGDHAEYCFYVRGHDNIIEDNDCHGVSYGGVHIYGGSEPAPTGNIVRDNRIHDIVTSFFFGVADLRTFGIYVSGNNSQIYNNVVHDLDLPMVQDDDSCIVIDAGSGNLVYNNTCTDNTATGGIKMSSGASGTIVRNNIFWANTGPNTSNYRNFGSNTTCSHNVNGGAGCTSNVTGDPQFTNVGANDFSLTSSSSARDTGTSIAAVAGIVTHDIIGTVRPQGSSHDIGAYEFFTGGGSTPPTVVITGPTSGETHATSTSPLTTFAGTCTDVDGTVSSVTWVNDRGGSGTASCSGCGTASATWSVPAGIALQTMDNVLTVTCTDSSMLTHPDSLTVTYTEPVSAPAGRRLRLVLP